MNEEIDLEDVEMNCNAALVLTLRDIIKYDLRLSADEILLRMKNIYDVIMTKDKLLEIINDNSNEETVELEHQIMKE